MSNSLRNWICTAVVVLLTQSSGIFAITRPMDEQKAPTQTEDEKQAPEDVKPADTKRQLTDPQQPGDDASPELKKPLRTPDEKQQDALAAYMEGIAAQKNGKLNQALEAFRKASEADPKAAEPVKARALLLMRLGRQQQAMKEARTAIELDPDDFETRIQLAVLILAGRRNLTEAAELIEEALQSMKLAKDSREFVSVHVVRGRFYIQVQDAAKAVQSYKVILNALEEPEKFGLDFREHQKLMTDRATGYETIGRIMLQVGQYDDAKRAFKGLVRINEDQPGNYHYLLALVQYRTDELDACEKNLELYFDTHKRSRESLELLSNLYSATSRSDQTVEKLQELTKDTSDANIVRLFIGDYLLDQGKFDQATKVFQAVIDETGDEEGNLGLVRVSILSRSADQLRNEILGALRAGIRIEELLPLREVISNDKDFGRTAVDAFVKSLADKSVKHHPAATFFYSQLAHSNYLDLPEQEGKLLQATLDQNPPAALGVEARSRLGLNQYMTDKYEEAVKTFRFLLAVPGLPQGERIMTLYRLSAAEAELGDFDKATDAIQEAIRLVPQNPQLMYQLGLIQLQAKKFDESEATLRGTIQAADGDPERQGQARILLGGLYSQLERWGEAVEVYKQVLQVPGTPAKMIHRAKSALSNAYVQSGDMANGEKVLEEVYAQTPDDPGVNNDLGYLYADQNKKLEQAEEMIRIAVKAEPENPAYLDSLGWVLYRLGKHEEALEALNKANADPDYRDSTIIEHLGDVQKALKRDDEARKSWQEALNEEKKSAAPNPASVQRLEKKIGE